MTPTILILPGWQDSGPEHWQSLWLKKYPNAVKVEQRDWMTPKKEEWVTTLEEYINRYESVILVGHSLGCPTIAHWAKEHPTSKVKGALLVAPFQKFTPEMTGFAPVPMESLPFPAIVVGSENDEWASMEEAQEFAKAWGAKFVNAGPAGHINTAAGYGEWPEGEELLKKLI
jgi:uncharacterized protein